MVKKEVLFQDEKVLAALGLEGKLSPQEIPSHILEAIGASSQITNFLVDNYKNLISERDKLRGRVNELEDRYQSMETQYQERIASLEEQVSIDDLTGVLNRRSFDRRSAVKSREADRHPETCCSLAMLDIDHFKQVNDTYSHQAGDDVLQRFAEIITGVKRDEDALFRYGGEEFTIILPQTNLEQAELVAERIRAAVEGTTFEYNERQIPITVSIGLAEYQKREGHGSVLSRADKALYEAKRSGRNRIVTSKQ
ncbi:MAG: GGDEF domain-containing protein [Candidatus Woesearchaeota archaeon]